MNKLISQLQRLYFLDDQQWHSQKSSNNSDPVYLAEGALTPAIIAQSLAGEMTVGLKLLSPDGMLRVMVVNFARASDWAQVAKLYQAVQEELDLPAPAISVSGRAGYRLWFSLAEALPVASAWVFLNALRLKYLADIPVNYLELRPGSDTPASAEPALIKLVPALHKATGRWSAFIDPTLGSMFIDESGLEMTPNLDRQAAMLAGLASIKAASFQRALNILQSPADSESGAGQVPMEQPGHFEGEAAQYPELGASSPPSRRLSVGNNYTDPRDFLLAVMNDASASVRQRVKAAKALLPYFAKEL